MITIENKQVFSTEDKYIHRLGTETYFKRGMVLPNDEVEDFEEVDELPKFTKSEYDAKVAELVRSKYSDSEEFAIQRKYLNSLSGDKNSDAVKEYEEYNTFVEQCKEDAKNPELYKTPEA